MNTRPASSIKENYDEIVNICRSTSEPVLLTQNGLGDLVVMDADTYFWREKMLELKEGLLAVEEDRAAGIPDCTVEELDAYLQKIIDEA